MHTGQLHVFHSLLSLPPILSLHLHSARWTANRNGVSSLTVTATTTAPFLSIYRRQALSGVGTILASYLPTEQHSDPSQLQGLQKRERQWQRAYQRRPTASVSEEKRQRQNHAHLCPQFTRASCQPIRSQHYVWVSWRMHCNAAI